MNELKLSLELVAVFLNHCLACQVSFLFFFPQASDLCTFLSFRINDRFGSKFNPCKVKKAVQAPYVKILAIEFPFRQEREKEVVNRGKRGAEREGKRLSMEAELGVLSRKTGACDVGNLSWAGVKVHHVKKDL